MLLGDLSGGYAGSGGYTLTVNGLASGLRLCIPTISGTNADLTGVGGTAGSNYIVFTATNVATPWVQWVPIATNQFDVFGVANHTNLFTPGEPQRYFRLLQP